MSHRSKKEEHADGLDPDPAYVIELLKRDAEKISSRFARTGRVKKPMTAKPNKVFLRNLIKGQSSHNRLREKSCGEPELNKELKKDEEKKKDDERERHTKQDDKPKSPIDSSR